MTTQRSRSKVLLFGLLLAAWLLPGLIGRDPWKADEAYSFGLVLNMLQTGDMVVPTLAAEPFLEKPPIFYVTATAFSRVLSPFLAPHEAARGACVLYLAIGLLCAALACRELYGRGAGVQAVLLLMGSLGLVHTAHMLQTDLSLVAGYTVAIYGMLLGLRRPWLGGLLCGTGTGLGFLSKGLLAPGILGLSVLCLLCFREWRTRNYWRFLGGIFPAVIPWVAIWPWALYQRSPELFHDWFWNNNVLRLIGGSPYAGAEHRPAWFYLTLLCGFGFPVFWLALWGLWRERVSAFREAGPRVVLVVTLVTLGVLSAASQKRSLYATPLLVPLALLAVGGLRRLGPRFTDVARRVILGVGCVGALAAWAGWIGLFAHWPTPLWRKVVAEVPGFAPSLSFLAFGVALTATAVWGAVCLSRKGALRPDLATAWASSVALLYLLAMTLWLPVTNGSSSYRQDFAGLSEGLGDQPGVIACQGLGEPQRAMVQYYAGIKPVRLETHPQLESRWCLVQGLDATGKRPQPPGAAWQAVWNGRHHRELFCLYRMDAKTSAP